jgi:hypothetical protein
LNDEIQVTLVYNANPDSLVYSGVILYDFDVVATLSLKYLSFKITLWNHFSNITLSKNLIFRASVYDPRFFVNSFY